MTIELIALDLDGTTLNSKGHLSIRNKVALETAAERGVNVVIATGRCYDALPDEILKVKGIQYAITSNGAQIRDLISGKAIYNNFIDSNAVEEAAKVLRVYDYMTEVFIAGSAFIEKSIYEGVRDREIVFRHRDYVVNTRQPVEKVLDFMLSNKNKIENINIFFPTMEDKNKMHPILQTIKNVTLTTSLDSNWEIGGSTTSKASALDELSNILKVPKSEIMACGDSPNDGDMLREAGIAVAVGNAKPVIKEIATFISGTNDEDGVAMAVEKFVLK